MTGVGGSVARPFQLRGLLDTLDDVRLARLVAREGEGYSPRWGDRWDSAEQDNLASVPPEAFDLVLG